MGPIICSLHFSAIWGNIQLLLSRVWNLGRSSWPSWASGNSRNLTWGGRAASRFRTMSPRPLWPLLACSWNICISLPRIRCCYWPTWKLCLLTSLKYIRSRCSFRLFRSWMWISATWGLEPWSTPSRIMSYPWSAPALCPFFTTLRTDSGSTTSALPCSQSWRSTRRHRRRAWRRSAWQENNKCSQSTCWCYWRR